MQVNLAVPNWIPYALTSIDRYRNLGPFFFFSLVTSH